MGWQKITSLLTGNRRSHTFNASSRRVKPIPINLSESLTSEKKRYLLLILQRFEHETHGYIPKGKYTVKNNGTKVKVKLSHTLLKYHKTSNEKAIRYEVLDDSIGKGSFGTIFNSLGVLTTPGQRIHFKQRKTAKERVIKQMLMFPYLTEEFVTTEAQNIEKSASALRCKPAFFADGFGYLIMTKIPGIPMNKLIKGIHKQNIQLDFLAYLKIILATMEAVAHLHSKGLVHCDIKPHNIMVDLETYQVTLVDFDFTCISHYDTSDFIKGTPLYIPPETVAVRIIEFDDPPHRIFARMVSTMGDVFSLGLTLKQFCGDLSLAQYEKTLTDDPLQFMQKIKFDEKFINLPTLPGPKEAIASLESLLHHMTRFNEDQRIALDDARQEINILLAQETKRSNPTRCDVEWDINPGLLIGV